MKKHPHVAWIRSVWEARDYVNVFTFQVHRCEAQAKWDVL